MFPEVQNLSKKRKWDYHPNHDENPEKPGFDLQNETPFPSEWQRCLDIKSGQIYFYNTRTNKRAFGDPRSTTLEPSSHQAPMSLELELNPPCQSLAKNHVEHGYKRGDSGRETIDHNNHTTSSKYPIKGDLKGLARSPSWLTIEGDQQEMVTAVCKKCYMLVMMCKSSPSCPNCKFVHPPETSDPSTLNQSLSLLC